MNKITLPYFFSFIISLLFINTISAQESYSLEQCRTLALQSNVKMLNAELEVQSAIQTKRATFTKYFPSIGARAGYFQSNEHFIDLNLDMENSAVDITLTNPELNNILQNIIAEYGQQIKDNINVNINTKFIDRGLVGSVTAVQPIFAGGRIVTGNQLAKVGVQAAELKKEVAQNEVLITVEETYRLITSLHRKQESIRVAKELLDTLERDASLAVEQGVIHKNDLLKVRLKKNELRSKEIQLKNGIVLTKMALCQQIGVTYHDSITFADKVEEIVDPWKYKVNHEEIQSQRSEYNLLELSVQAVNLQKRMVIGEALPEAGVGIGYLYNNLMDKHKGNAVIFATVQVPISAWWEAAHQIKKYNIEEQIAENNRRDLTEKMLLQTQQLWNETEEVYLQIEVAQSAVEEATENYKLSYDRYQAGVVSITDLLEAQTILQQSKDQYDDVCIEYLLKLQKYRLVTRN